MTTYAEWFANARRTFLLQTIVEAKGNLSAAANELDIHRNTLHRMMREHGIPSSITCQIRQAQPIENVPNHSTNTTRHIYRKRA